MNPRAPSWSPTKRDPWKAGSLGGKNRNQLLRKSWDKNSKDGSIFNEPDSIRQQRFSADTTLEELEELDNGTLISTPESLDNEFDRLLKRYVHMDPQAMKAARTRFAKRILDQMNTPNSYTLHFKKDKTKADGAGDVPERIRGASWASDADTSDDDDDDEDDEKDEDVEEHDNQEVTSVVKTAVTQEDDWTVKSKGRRGT